MPVVGPATSSAGQQQQSGTGAQNVASHQRMVPKDAQVIQAILRELGVTDYEPRIVHQMLEFVYRYVSKVVEEAHSLSQYAKKKQIDAEDVKLAVQLHVEKCFTVPPPRDLLVDIAKAKNSQSLPNIKSHNGPRIPPDRFSLISANYKLRSVGKGPSNSAQIQLPFRASGSLLSGSMMSGSSTSFMGAARLNAPNSSMPQPSGASLSLSSALSNSSTPSGVKRKAEDGDS